MNQTNQNQNPSREQQQREQQQREQQQRQNKNQPGQKPGMGQKPGQPSTTTRTAADVERSSWGMPAAGGHSYVRRWSRR